VIGARGARRARVNSLAGAGAEVILLAARGGAIDPRAVARALGERGLLSVMVEGGAETHAAFLAAGVCDRLLLYVAPKVFGGRAPAWVGGEGVARIAGAPGFRLVAQRRLGEDLLLELER
jgi:diaminohydroxyphosphoribosylaminopyrimidine deaminase/5-amino-6-(5-phosphoribosylamino)uracil reductase